MTRHQGHIADNVDLMRQGIAAVGMVGPDAYRGGSSPGAVSPIGAHFRHVLDHYHAFLDGLQSGMLNYDVRERNPLVERDANVATATAQATIDRLGDVSDSQLARIIQVSANVIEDGKSVAHWTGSTVQRELMYLLSHTVHHYAIIRLLATQVGVELDADFGVAPSTIAHRRLHEACVPSAG